MVFRRFQRNSLRPINRIKHVVDFQFATVAGTPVPQILIKTVDAPVLANTNEVETGSSVNGIYLKVETNATSSAALSNAYMIVYKNPGFNIADPNAQLVGSDDNKRFVIHQEMVMLQQQDGSNPRTVFNGVIAIPKGYRRNAPNDQLRIVLSTPGTNNNWCIQCHYKEFR